MTDDEIRKPVRAKPADGTLPREQPVIAQPVVPGRPVVHQMEGGAALWYPCVVCGGEPTQFHYPQVRMALHERCHRIWLEEIEKLW